MAIDNKYGRVTTEKGSLGEDEPVIVFRAKDALLPALLAEYRHLCELSGSPERHLTLIDRSRQDVIRWQTEHHHQVPRSDVLK